MRVHLAEQAQAILGPSDLVIITERVDDVALRMGPMVPRGLPEVLDRPIPRPGQQRRISWGGTAVSWWASILTEGDPRNVSVATYLKGMPHPRSRLSAQVIEPLDCRDARLSHLLTPGSTPASGHPMAQEGNARRLAGYPLPQDVIRGDATTVSGDHEVPAGGL